MVIWPAWKALPYEDLFSYSRRAQISARKKIDGARAGPFLVKFFFSRSVRGQNMRKKFFVRERLLRRLLSKQDGVYVLLANGDQNVFFSKSG